MGSPVSVSYKINRTTINITDKPMIEERINEYTGKGYSLIQRQTISGGHSGVRKVELVRMEKMPQISNRVSYSVQNCLGVSNQKPVKEVLIIRYEETWPDAVARISQYYSCMPHPR